MGDLEHLVLSLLSDCTDDDVSSRQRWPRTHPSVRALTCQREYCKSPAPLGTPGGADADGRHQRRQRTRDRLGAAATFCEDTGLVGASPSRCCRPPTSIFSRDLARTLSVSEKTEFVLRPLENPKNILIGIPKTNLTEKPTIFFRNIFRTWIRYSLDTCLRCRNDEKLRDLP